MENNEQLPHKLMVLIALIQGLCLLYLHQAIELDYWPNNHPQWLFAFYSVALILPVMLLLSLKPGNTLGIVKYSLPFALLCGFLGYYVGLQATPIEHVRFDALLFSYALTISLATFKALMYIQQLAAGERINYAGLFRWSWRNFLTLSLALLFAGSFWLILLLWGALFKAINIDFFKELFQEPWFYYPAIALANGFGVIIFRRLTHIIDTITRLQQALMKFLLILLVLVSILFLCALPFTGLDPLWESGGSALILWMQALMLFFVNAVYQDDPQQRPYSLWLHRFIYLGVALLPIYSAISCYGLSLRIDQYGWSLARCWAFLIWFLLALFPLGYWWGIAKKLDNWVIQLSRVNVVVGLAVLAMMLLINSPLLDFRKIVVNDQLKRLANNTIEPDDFDLYYFRRKLAKPGYEALQQIKEQYAETHPEIVVRINQLYQDRKTNQPSSTKEEFVAAVSLLTEDVPPELLDAIYENQIQSAWQVQNTKKYYLQSLDLNKDSQTDYILAANRHSSIYFTLYYFEEGGWKNITLNSTEGVNKQSQQAIINALKAGEFKITRPQWNHLEIGNKTFQAWKRRY
jgi:hypothetical protein